MKRFIFTFAAFLTSLPAVLSDNIVTELTPLLSPESTILLPTNNATLFTSLTSRYIEVFHPDTSAIVTPGTAADIPVIISYALLSNRSILPQNRRHGWATSLSSVHDAIMIDLSHLKSISISPTSNTMTIGPGVSNGEVAAALHAAGKETSIGICDCVGYLGAALGGGHGRLQGMHGLIADNLLSARLATSSGIITVSAASHRSLFWGLRGAGHNFGIVTEAVFRVYDETSGGVQFSADLIYHPDYIEALYEAVNGFEPAAETSVLIFWAPQPPLQPLIALHFTSSTPAAAARSQLDAVFGHIPALSRTESLLPWDEVNTVGGLGVGHTGCTNTQRKNAYGVSLKKYDVAAVREVFNSYVSFLEENPLMAGTIILWETYSRVGVQAVDAKETAYAGREEKNILMFATGFTAGGLSAAEIAALDAAGVEWLLGARDRMQETGGFEKMKVYLNYAQGTEGFGALYGYERWRQEKLKMLKRKWDGGEMFSAYHPIPI